MHLISTRTVLIIVLFWLPLLSFSQTNTTKNNYSLWFDQVLNPEYTGLSNGVQYVNTEVNRGVKNEHPYFLNTSVKGSIKYDNQHYQEVEMKYNLESEELIIKLNSGSVFYVIKLIYDKIDTFTIRDSKFIKINDLYSDGSMIRKFYEVLYQDSTFTLLKHHKKKKTAAKTEGKTQYYRYLSTIKHILYYDNTYNEIKSKSDIIALFPESKIEIKEFYQQYRPLLKRDTDLFFKRLLTQVIKPSILKKEY